jgi:uncharacterized protein (DUF1501 family)
MALSRRNLLKASAVAGLASVPGLSSLSFAAAGAAPKLLVIVHLRGGCDGLNLISPANDPEFVAARSAELRVTDSGAEVGFPLANGSAPSIDFRLHHAAPGLNELYKGGHLTFIHAAGLKTPTRSHFVAIDMIERGVPDLASLGRVPQGWAARQFAGRATGTPSLSASAALSGEFAGWGASLSVPDLSGGFGPPGGPQANAVLTNLYAHAPGDVGAAGRTALGAIHAIDQRLPRDAQGKILPYEPAPGSVYQAAGDFARPLRVVAQLAKLDLGLSVATVDIGGWDTHEHQAGRFKPLVERMSAGLAAFYNDLAPLHDRLTIVVISEFGRRLRSNRSGGTDHGRGNVMAILGGGVAGGRMLGPWPGLASQQLEEGVDLAVITDYRQVILEAIDAGPNQTAFPGFRAGPKLGILRAA